VGGGGGVGVLGGGVETGRASRVGRSVVVEWGEGGRIHYNVKLLRGEKKTGLRTRALIDRKAWGGTERNLGGGGGGKVGVLYNSHLQKRRKRRISSRE